MKAEFIEVDLFGRTVIETETGITLCDTNLNDREYLIGSPEMGNWHTVTPVGEPAFPFDEEITEINIISHFVTAAGADVAINIPALALGFHRLIAFYHEGICAMDKGLLPHNMMMTILEETFRKIDCIETAKEIVKILHAEILKIHEATAEEEKINLVGKSGIQTVNETYSDPAGSMAVAEQLHNIRNANLLEHAEPDSEHSDTDRRRDAGSGSSEET